MATNGVSKLASSNYNNGFYKVGDTTSNGTKVTASNVGNINSSYALGNASWAAPVAAQLNSTSTYTNPYGSGRTPTTDTGTGSTGSTSSTGSNYSSYLSNLYSDYAAQRQAALESAYGNSKSGIESAYASALGSIADAYNNSSALLQQNYDASNNALNTTYNNDLQGLNEDAAKSLKEAYVNKMLSQKNLNQQLSAQGLSGGATESTLASLLNNYGNSRNNINTTLNTNIRNLDASKIQSLADILNNYNSNLASLNQYKASAESSAYQNKASALASIEQAYASAMADVLSDSYDNQLSALQYLAKSGNNVDLSALANYTGTGASALQSALQRLANTQVTDTQATNTVNNASTNQTGVNNISSSTNYEELMKILQALGVTA